MKVNVTSVLTGLLSLALAAGMAWITVFGLPSTKAIGISCAVTLVAIGAVGLLLTTRNQTD